MQRPNSSGSMTAAESPPSKRPCDCGTCASCIGEDQQEALAIRNITIRYSNLGPGEPGPSCWHGKSTSLSEISFERVETPVSDPGAVAETSEDRKPTPVRAILKNQFRAIKALSKTEKETDPRSVSFSMANPATRGRKDTTMDIKDSAKTTMALSESSATAKAKIEQEVGKDKIYSRRGSLFAACEKAAVNGPTIGAPCESEKELMNLSPLTVRGFGVLPDRYSIEGTANAESYSSWNDKAWEEQVSP